MELEVLAQYGELDKIGQPEALDTKAAEAQPAAISGNNFYGSKTAPAPQPQRSLPTQNVCFIQKLSSCASPQRHFCALTGLFTT